MSVRLVTLVLACLLTGAIVAACGGPIGPTPRPTAADFEGLVGELAALGIGVLDARSGDSGCSDPTLAAPAISFDAKGLDQAELTKVRVYIFRNRDAYDRRRADVDACAREFVTDPSTFESVDAPPFVAIGAGPWGPQFRDALRAALTAGSGNPAAPVPSGT